MFRLRVSVPLLAAIVIAALPVAAQPKTGAQFFYDYLAACAKAKGFSEVASWMSKGEREKLAAMSPEQQKAMWDLGKQVQAQMRNVKVVKETPTADGAVLEVTGIGPDNKPFKEIVKLVKEGGAWKWNGDEVVEM